VDLLVSVDLLASVDQVQADLLASVDLLALALRVLEGPQDSLPLQVALNQVGQAALLDSDNQAKVMVLVDPVLVDPVLVDPVLVFAPKRSSVPNLAGNYLVAQDVLLHQSVRLGLAKRTE
jgi:hypothetical protein